MAERRERAQEEQHKIERGVAGRVCQVLLPEDRSRQGKPSRLLPFDLSYAFLSRSRSCSPGLIKGAACLETSMKILTKRVRDMIFK